MKAPRTLTYTQHYHPYHIPGQYYALTREDAMWRSVVCTVAELRGIAFPPIGGKDEPGKLLEQ